MRIASLAPSVTIMLQELDAADQIVACTSLCPLPVAERKAKAVGSFSVLNEEKIAAAMPDLVVTATLVQEKGATRLRGAGYDVLHLDPRRLSDIAQSYLLLGQRVDKAAEGKALQNTMLAKLNELEKSLWQPRPRVYMEEWHEPPYVSGNWVPDLVALAGGESVLIKPGEPSKQISIEELVDTDPDIIIQHVCLPPLWLSPTSIAHQQRAQQRELFRQQLLARPGWDTLRAVRSGNVHAIDDTPFNMPTKDVLQGITLLKKVVDSATVQNHAI